MLYFIGKYHWHVYKEVGDEISRVRNNDNTYKNSNKYRYRIKNQQNFYTYFTLYGKSLTSRNVKDNQLQIVLPATHSANMDRADSASDYLEIDYFATMTEIIHIENIVDVFNEKKKSMEELLNNSPLDQEKWYRIQMEKINSRLPICQEDIPDTRVPNFIPDNWQIEFLDAVDKQQSIIIVSPTSSGKTYASYYAMNKVLKYRDDSNGIFVYAAPTNALVNQVAFRILSVFLSLIKINL
ncbi:unnamed protein product [Rotaria sp. Silwood1]|nr:unnamed protein product [Rotaria sp. Silwood1]